MREPIARSTSNGPDKTAASPNDTRTPQAFSVDAAQLDSHQPADWQALETTADVIVPESRTGWWGRLALGAGGLLISLGLALAAERLIADLFTRFDWLGWAGLGLTALLVLALFALSLAEFRAVRRLANLDAWRNHAAAITTGGSRSEGAELIAKLQSLYYARPDLARPRQKLDLDLAHQFDGTEMIASAERHLMAPLDARARALTTAAARRVALVTAVSPRALVDVAFVAYESLKLTRAIALLYGAKPGLFSGWRLSGAVLSHLAVTGGVALGDSVIQQLLGQGLAARLSARLGEGLVNGLMTARVGIAAMQVTRPLPFHAVKKPQVMEFALDLGNIVKTEANQKPGS